MTFPAFTLDISGVRVSRGARVIVENFSMSVRSGDLVWVRGTNGVGKTSLLRMAAGLTRPDSGVVSHKSDGLEVR